MGRVSGQCRAWWFRCRVERLGDLIFESGIRLEPKSCILHPAQLQLEFPGSEPLFRTKHETWETLCFQELEPYMVAIEARRTVAWLCLRIDHTEPL